MGMFWEGFILAVMLVGIFGPAGILIFGGVCVVYLLALALLSDVSK